MKPTQRTDAIRNIRKKIISFISVVFIVALGMGGFFATQFTDEALKVQGEEWYDQHGFRDFDIASSAGMTEEDIQTITAIEGVEAAEGLQSITANLRGNDHQKTIQLLSLTEQVSVPEAIEGTLPEGKDECMIASDVAAETGLKPGDAVEISLSDPSVKEDLLEVHQFTISGIMYHPEYIRPGMTGSVVVPIESFDSKKTRDLFPHAFVRVTKPEDVSMFDDEYFDETASIKQKLQDVVDIQQAEGTERMRQMANDQIDRKWKKAEKKLNDAKQKLEDAEAQLEAALADGRNKLEAGERKLKDAKAKLDRGEKKVKKAEKELKKAKKKLKEAEKALGDLTPKEVVDMLDEALFLTNELGNALDSKDEEEIASAEADIANYLSRTDVQKMFTVLAEYGEVNVDKVKKHLEKGDLLSWVKKELESIRKDVKEIMDAPDKIEKAEKKLKKAKKKLKKGKKEYAAGEKKLADGWALYYSEKEKNEQKLSDAWDEYNEKEKEAKDQLADARKQADELEGHAVIMDLRCNAGYVDLRTNIGAIGKAGSVFGLLFLLVGAMVCFSTLALIIEEQQRLVGTTKAFGLRGNEILGKYLIFGIGAALFGSIAGVALAMGLANLVLFLIVRSGMYVISSFSAILLPVPSVLAGIISMVLCGAVTVLACTGLLRTPASMLMQGNTLAKSRFREKMRSTGHSARSSRSLYSRLILRNMREDKVRVFLTVAIILGSCFVIGLGFTTRAGFTGMMEAQQTQVHAYDTRVDLGIDVTDEQREDIRQYLDEQDVEWVPAIYEAHLYNTEDQTDAIYVFAVDPDQVSKIFTLRDPKTQKLIRMPEEGILIGNRLHETTDYDAGDTMELYGKDLSLGEGTITGQYQCYEGRMVIMSKDTYASVFNVDPEDNSIYLQFAGADKKTVEKGLQAISEDISFEDSDAFITRFESTKNIYNAVVAIMIAIAITMSFMILLNLTNIYVSRKKKEIITMRVNGFSQRQTDRYLSMESLFMSVAGLVLAMITGFLTTGLFIRVLEQPDVQFIRDPSIVLWGGAALIEASFILIISLIAFRKTRKYQLREIAES